MIVFEIIVYESDNIIGEDDKKYFKLISDIHQLQQNGNEDTNAGMIFSVLVYIVLHGSATDEDIDYKVLTNIYNSIYKTDISSKTVSIESCLAELVPKYLDQVDEKFTPCSINIVKAVVYTFGNVSCECLVQNCSLDVMIDYVVPSGTITDDLHVVVVDICVLACALVKRMKTNSDVRSVGGYIYKSFAVHENVEICNLFIDTLEQSNENFTSRHMIYLLDGLTKDGTKFSIFDKLEKLFNLFCRQIDEFGNTVFHYLVVYFRIKTISRIHQVFL
ncbi:unnamed protein product [Mytilus edulis]|uniref:Uncharacterized protein n=1 Tax=Mytilus edulis TaxID=6550 RepID=A0A8S3VS27_MYTED|nr:unnamed protein product [Mytilus edulis]